MARMGGFRTHRVRAEDGRPLRFELISPDGSQRETFLDLSCGRPLVRLEVFSGLGIQLLQGSTLVLDEIGGVELLCPEFMDALEQVLQRDIPVIGVLKGEGPAGKLIEKLGLAEEYETAVCRLRHRLQADENTRVYTCEQYDVHALELARNWVEQYVL